MGVSPSEWLARKKRFPILDNHDRRGFQRAHDRNHEPLAVGRYVEAKYRVNGSSRFGADGEKRCRGAEFGFRREPYGNRLHTSIKAKIEKLLPIASPPHRLGA